MDPLSDVLSLLRPRSYTFGRFDIGGAWSLAFPSHAGIRCYALLSGACWLQVETLPAPARVNAGDCFLLAKGHAFTLASDLALPAVNIKTILSAPLNGGVLVHQGGGDCFGVGGYFDFAGSHADMLLGVLPPVVHIRTESDKAAMRWALDRAMQELRDPQPGGVLIGEHLAQMILVQALRLHLADASQGVGWLFALADRQLGAAIGAIHADPARSWTLQDLAACAGMSRSSFALRFRQRVGASPIDYLVRWRMLLAADRLENSADPISVIAPSLGYESDSAFSAAFRRVMGCSPRNYSREAVSLS